MAALAAAAAGNPRIIVDLAALEFIDCCALGVLGRVRAQTRQAGGDLLLAAPRGPVQRILALTGLIGVFSVHASVEQAVQAADGSRLVVTAGNHRPVPGVDELASVTHRRARQGQYAGEPVSELRPGAALVHSMALSSRRRAHGFGLKWPGRSSAC